MKVNLRFHFAFTYCLLFSVFFLYGPALNAQRINITLGSGPCSFDFNLSPASSFSGNVNGVSYFWYFGDGSWTASNSPTASHTYSTAGSYSVYVEATPVSTRNGVYDDDDLPTRFAESSTGPAIANPSGTCQQNTPRPSPLQITSNRSLVPGDIVTYIVRYCNICTEKRISAQLEFKFNNTQLAIEFDTLNNMSMPTIPATSPPQPSGTPDIDFITLPNILLQGGQCADFLVRMRLLNTVRVGEIVEVSADLKVQSNNNCNETDTFSQPIVKSHDPNTISGSVGFTCDGIAPLYRYVIKFQNDGSAHESNITIKNFIPEYFDDATLNVVYPLHESTNLPPPTQTDATTGEKYWALNTNYIKNRAIKGLAQNGYMDSFFEDETIDYLIYDIAPKSPVKLRECDAVVNQAEITFANQAAIYTNADITRVGCFINPIDSLCSCEMETDTINLPELTYSATSAVDLYDNSPLFPSISSHSFEWYPIYALDNPNIHNPKAQPTKNMHYYAVATHLCSRVILHRPVKYISGGTGGGAGSSSYWPIILGAVVVLGLVLFLIKAMRKP